MRPIDWNLLLYCWLPQELRYPWYRTFDYFTLHNRAALPLLVERVYLLLHTLLIIREPSELFDLGWWNHWAPPQGWLGLFRGFMIIDKADLTEWNQCLLILSDNFTLSLGQECVRNTLFAHRLMIYDLCLHLIALDYVFLEGHRLAL